MGARNQMRRRMMGAGRKVATFVGITSKLTSTTTAITLPAGAQVGDLAIICANISSGALAAPGWTKVTDKLIYGAGQNQAVLFKVLTASDLSSPGSLTSVAGGGSYICAVYRGATSIVEVGYRSNPTNTGAVTISNLPAPSGSSKGWISIAVDRDSASGPFFPGTEAATGWVVRGAHWASSFYPTTLADTLPKWGPKQQTVAWSVINGSYGEAAFVFELR